jgi:type IV pilus assembly protein PilE
VAGIALNKHHRNLFRGKFGAVSGMTLIELTIVVTVVAILMALAVPSYSKHSLRVHRSEAIRLLLQASICQEHVYAKNGNYDTSQCMPTSEYQRYQLGFQTQNEQSQSYTAIATPMGVQYEDVCGSLSLDQSGMRSISATGVSVSKCWNSR